MKWFRSPVTHAVTVIATLVVAWMTEGLNELPSPAQAVHAFINLQPENTQRPEEGFRVVLSWLENDRSGDDTEIVEDAFQNIEGITLVRSARIVAASGAWDKWRPAMQQSARVVMEDWNADLVVAGRVKQSKEILSLWFVLQTTASILDLSGIFV